MTTGIEDSAKGGFVYWQCQIRKFSVRNFEAKPTSGICPDLVIDENELGIITTVLVPSAPEDDINHLKHAYQKTFDPLKRRENALKYLQSDFYQFPHRFSGELTALAAKGARWIDKVLAAKQVQLLFDQDSKRWQLDSEVEILSADDQRWQFTFAHNRLFNHTLTSNVEIILFKPIWEISDN